MNKQEFIIKALNLNQNKYNYSNINYIDTKTPIEIFCNIHNIVFYQTPSNHIHQTQGCKFCGLDKLKNKFKLSKEEFIEKSIFIFGDKFDYKYLDYINNRTKVKLICKEHDIEFEQVPSKHFLGQIACPICKKLKFARMNAFTLDEFIIKANRVHNNKYDYSNSTYINAHTQISIFCKIHNLYFNQTPSDHIYQESGCLICANEKSIILNHKQINRFKDNGEMLGTLYLIKLFDKTETFYKIGCSSKDINIRIRKFPYNIEILKTKQDTIKNISMYEQQIINNFKQFAYIPNKHFSGYTECFSEEILKYL